MSENVRLNLAVVIGIVGVALIVAVGSVYLATTGRAVPDSFGNIILAIVSGLIGYLARDPKHPTVDASGSERVNVDTSVEKTE